MEKSFGNNIRKSGALINIQIRKKTKFSSGKYCVFIKRLTEYYKPVDVSVLDKTEIIKTWSPISEKLKVEG